MNPELGWIVDKFLKYFSAHWWREWKYIWASNLMSNNHLGSFFIFPDFRWRCFRTWRIKTMKFNYHLGFSWPTTKSTFMQTHGILCVSGLRFYKAINWTRCINVLGNRRSFLRFLFSENNKERKQDNGKSWHQTSSFSPSAQEIEIPYSHH